MRNLTFYHAMCFISFWIGQNDNDEVNADNSFASFTTLGFVFSELLLRALIFNMRSCGWILAGNKSNLKPVPFRPSRIRDRSRHSRDTVSRCAPYVKFTHFGHRSSSAASASRSRLAYALYLAVTTTGDERRLFNSGGSRSTVGYNGS